MNNQFNSRLIWVKVILITIGLTCSNILQAALSDDFNPTTKEANPVWRFYDPYNINAKTGNQPGESNLTYSGTNALINIPAGLSHDLWVTPNKNKAPRLLQPTNNTDFGIEVKYETVPNSETQSQGIIVQQTDDIFLRFDVYYTSAGPRLFVGYVNGVSGNVHKSILLQNFPKYRQVLRSGNQWTFLYSFDGKAWTTAATFNRALTVTEVGVFAGTSGSNPKFQSSIDYFMDLAHPIEDSDGWLAEAPVINAWYGSTQPFGVPGISQQWANVLGNVFSDLELSELTYKINGGLQQTLPFGPDRRRLAKYGDFNIEIDSANLINGSNNVEIKAIDVNGRITTKNVTINYSPGNSWSLPYTADWSKLSSVKNIEGIAHVVDGLWEKTPAGIRTAQAGYDRTIAIGDKNWSSNYEVTVPITVHSNFAGIGFAVGWQGHSGTKTPRIEWPLQSLAWIRGPLSNATLEIITYGGLSGWEVIETPNPQQSVSIAKDETYMLKSRSESLNNGMSRFYVKFWPQNTAEPVAWKVYADVPIQDGSVLLVAYNVDATFGNVVIKPISVKPDITAPEISNIRATVTDTKATITWNTNKAADSLVDYGLTKDYGEMLNNTSLVTTHSLTLQGLTPKTLYHYRVSSSDGSNNIANSVDLSFTTKDFSNGSSSGMVSDDFNGSLDTNLWTFNDPTGNSTLSMTGTQASISVPAGTSHDLWKNALFAPRLRQATNDTDFEVEAKFDSALSTKFQLHGITVEQDDINLLRFDFYSDGSVTRIFSASFVNGNPRVRINKVISSSTSRYLRVKRLGDEWTVSYSSDGSNWSEAGAYSHKLSATSVTLLAGNAGSTPPSYTGLVDYFMVDGFAPGQERSVARPQGTSQNNRNPVSSGDSSTVKSSEKNTVNSFSSATSGMVSDNFNGSLKTNVWHLKDPVGNSTLLMTGTQAAIMVPAGTSHDLWKNGLFAPRLRQTTKNTDFEVEAKFDSALSTKFQLHGITVEQDDANLMRFDFYTDGSVTRIFSASFVNGKPRVQIKKTIASSTSRYLRVKRLGDQWTVSYSSDGSNWSEAGVYTHKLSATSVGLFAGNAGSTPPKYTGLVDYFMIDGNAPEQGVVGANKPLEASKNNSNPVDPEVITTPENNGRNATDAFVSVASGMVSDDFNGLLKTNIWHLKDPIGNSTLLMTGTQAAISVPAGTSHDLWKNGLFAPRLRQNTKNTDFEVEAKFDSALSTKFQLHGITIEQDDANLMRFDFYTDGSVTRIFSASFVNGKPLVRIKKIIASSTSRYLRVKRSGNQWTVSYSSDGSNWSEAGVYTHKLSATSVGLLAGNAGPKPPKYSALVDYFKVE